MEDKTRLTAQLDNATESFERLRSQIDDAKRENCDRFLRLRTEIGHREEANRELAAELAATKVSPGAEGSISALLLVGTCESYLIGQF